jgi:hypothetical protein
MNLCNLLVVEFIQYAIRQRAVFAEEASFNIPIIVPFESTTLYCPSLGTPGILDVTLMCAMSAV